MPPATPPRTGRHRIFPGVPVELPDPIGAVELRYRGSDLADLEDRLEPYLLRAHDRIPPGDPRWISDRNPDGAHPDSVFDGLDVLLNLWTLRVLSELLGAAVAHAGHDRADVDELPPSIYDDDELVEGLMTAIAYAFGMDPADVEAASGPPTNRAARRAQARSTGRPSSPSGPPLAKREV